MCQRSSRGSHPVFKPIVEYVKKLYLKKYQNPSSSFRWANRVEVSAILASEPRLVGCVDGRVVVESTEEREDGGDRQEEHLEATKAPRILKDWKLGIDFWKNLL